MKKRTIVGLTCLVVLVAMASAPAHGATRQEQMQEIEEDLSLTTKLVTPHKKWGKGDVNGPIFISGKIALEPLDVGRRERFSQHLLIPQALDGIALLRFLKGVGDGQQRENDYEQYDLFGFHARATSCRYISFVRRRSHRRAMPKRAGRRLV